MSAHSLNQSLNEIVRNLTGASIVPDRTNSNWNPESEFRLESFKGEALALQLDLDSVLCTPLFFDEFPQNTLRQQLAKLETKEEEIKPESFGENVLSRCESVTNSVPPIHEEEKQVSFSGFHLFTSPSNEEVINIVVNERSRDFFELFVRSCPFYEKVHSERCLLNFQVKFFTRCNLLAFAALNEKFSFLEDAILNFKDFLPAEHIYHYENFLRWSLFGNPSLLFSSLEHDIGGCVDILLRWNNAELYSNERTLATICDFFPYARRERSIQMFSNILQQKGADPTLFRTLETEGDIKTKRKVIASQRVAIMDEAENGLPARFRQLFEVWRERLQAWLAENEPFEVSGVQLSHTLIAAGKTQLFIEMEPCLRNETNEVEDAWKDLAITYCMLQSEGEYETLRRCFRAKLAAKHTYRVLYLIQQLITVGYVEATLKELRRLLVAEEQQGSAEGFKYTKQDRFDNHCAFVVLPLTAAVQAANLELISMILHEYVNKRVTNAKPDSAHMQLIDDDLMEATKMLLYSRRWKGRGVLALLFMFAKAGANFSQFSDKLQTTSKLFEQKRHFLELLLQGDDKTVKFYSHEKAIQLVYQLFRAD